MVRFQHYRCSMLSSNIPVTWNPRTVRLFQKIRARDSNAHYPGLHIRCQGDDRLVGWHLSGVEGIFASFCLGITKKTHTHTHTGSRKKAEKGSAGLAYSSFAAVWRVGEEERRVDRRAGRQRKRRPVGLNLIHFSNAVPNPSAPPPALAYHHVLFSLYHSSTDCGSEGGRPQNAISSGHEVDVPVDCNGPAS